MARRNNLSPSKIRIEGQFAYVELTQDKEAIINIEDIHLVSSHKWCAVFRGNTFYAERTIRENGKTIHVHMHRIIANPPEDKMVDHENKNGLINTRKNLRIATRSQNFHNQGIRLCNTSGYRGVQKTNSGKWSVSIRENGKNKRLGVFSCPIEASNVYESAAKRIHGEFYCPP